MDCCAVLCLGNEECNGLGNQLVSKAPETMVTHLLWVPCSRSGGRGVCARIFVACLGVGIFFICPHARLHFCMDDVCMYVCMYVCTSVVKVLPPPNHFVALLYHWTGICCSTATDTTTILAMERVQRHESILHLEAITIIHCGLDNPCLCTSYNNDVNLCIHSLRKMTIPMHHPYHFRTIPSKINTKQTSTQSNTLTVDPWDNSCMGIHPMEA